MKPQSKSIFISNLLIVVILCSTTASIIAQEVGEEPEFDYIEGSPKGPQHWGELKPEWAECKDGQSQSPINILNKNVKIASKTGDLRLNYKASNATVKNTGFSIEGDAGSIHIDGKDYPLQQCHWHLPSEHLINGKRYELELHMAHIDASNKISVAHAQFYQIGEPDSFLSKFTEEIKSLVKKKEERPKGVIDPRDSNMEAVKYYKYNGSQTFPPCAEGITWIINEKVNTVSNEQVQLLREANFDYAKNNARPVQALNGREIFRYC
ncbi:hypothetical protein RGQ29_026042 [Quercus rubra]|uniref:Carbonic anhydrase n=1 Tax=Quercus rubra TaxID=3512 RepID=A0AAN7F014_QUERU|nr:hypothetical protein RGQ29_026042 [Quercus rubra]